MATTVLCSYHSNLQQSHEDFGGYMEMETKGRVAPSLIVQVGYCALAREVWMQSFRNVIMFGSSHKVACHLIAQGARGGSLF